MKCISYYTVGARRPGQARKKYLHTYLGNLATRRGKHFMYVVTVETPRRGQARHTHLRSYRGNLKNECVDVYFVVVPAVIVKSLIVCMYVYIYTYVLYCSINARRTITRLMWKPELVVSVIYHPRIRETQLCVLFSPAIWWWSVELQRESVTLLKYI
jgi:hypothetical protein